jgi:uncharacterized protein YwqG
MQREEAIELIRSSALSKHAGKLIKYLLPSARLIVNEQPTGQTDAAINSHLGGLPYLPMNVAWPRWDKREYLAAKIVDLEKRLKVSIKTARDYPQSIPEVRAKEIAKMRDDIVQKRKEMSSGPLPLTFLGQLSLSEICAVAPLSGWPRQGSLAFFYDFSQPWGFSLVDRGHCQVLFIPEDVPVIPAEFPDELEDEARYPGRFVTAKCEWMLPTFLRLKIDNVALWVTDEYRDLLKGLNSYLNEDPDPHHRCGGFPEEIQNDMEIQCQLVTNGIYCGDESGYANPRRAKLEKSAADWQLLAQFDSDNSLGWDWGISGRVYFWARQQDIEVADFRNCWAILQCAN